MEIRTPFSRALIATASALSLLLPRWQPPAKLFDGTWSRSRRGPAPRKIFGRRINGDLKAVRYDTPRSRARAARRAGLITARQQRRLRQIWRAQAAHTNPQHDAGT